MTTSTTTQPTIDQGTWTLDKAHTRFGFVARHLMVTKVRGHFEEFDATFEIAEDPSESQAEIALNASSITTGTADRDNHLRSPDFLNAEEYPEIHFVSTRIENDGDVWRVEGDLTIRETTHPITLDVVYEGSATDPWGNEHVAFSATATIKRADWDLTWNVPLEGGGWLVSPEVHLEIEGQLIRA